MAVKQIIQNSFEQILETGKGMAKSSGEQIKQTINPWDIIRNSFLENGTSAQQDTSPHSKELKGKGGNSTPLDFGKLDKQYTNQDQQHLERMKQRLFQIVKRDEESTSMKGKQDKAQKERSITQGETEQRNQNEAKKRQQGAGNLPQGRTGRGTALLGKKRRQATEPQPAETKPGSSKQ